MTARQELMGLLIGKWIPPVLATLVELGIADEVAEKALTAEDLAEREWAALAGAAGLRPRAVVQRDDRFSLLEAT